MPHFGLPILATIEGFVPSFTTMVGYTASAAVLLTFMTTRMRQMRLLAIASNIFFLAYGALAWLPPVLGLHLVLLPLNIARLVQLERIAARASRR